MSDFQFDKAFMAVKAQRYEEAQNAYEKALDRASSVEGWTGLGICKLFQLSDNQTMEEVIFCFNKAKEVESADSKEIDLQLISYSTLVIEQYTNYSINLITKLIEAEQAQKDAAIISATSLVVGGLSDSGTMKTLSGIAAGAAAGVTVGKFGEIANIKEAGQFALNLINDIHTNVNDFLVDNSKISEATALNSRVNELTEKIRLESEKKALVPKWYHSNGKLALSLLFWPIFIYGLIMRLMNPLK